MVVTTPSGCRIENADERLLTFLREEWAYYDGLVDTAPNEITVLDVLAPVMMNAYIGGGADRLQRLHRGLQSAVPSLLAAIPVDADLQSYDRDLIATRQLLGAAIAVPGILVPVATKILHRKRRALIPMLDNILLAHYLRLSGPESLPWTTQDKRLAAAIAIDVLAGIRRDLIACYEELAALSKLAADSEMPVTPLRALELLVWTEIEPRGYYRR